MNPVPAEKLLAMLDGWKLIQIKLSEDALKDEEMGLVQTANMGSGASMMLLGSIFEIEKLIDEAQKINENEVPSSGIVLTFTRKDLFDSAKDLSLKDIEIGHFVSLMDKRDIFEAERVEFEDGNRVKVFKDRYRVAGIFDKESYEKD